MVRLASIDDFETRYGPVPADRRGRVEALLDDASALILEEVDGSTEPWVTTGSDVPRIVVMVCCAIAYRGWRATDDVHREQIGEYAVTYRTDQPTDVWLTKDERRNVRKAAGLGLAQTVTLVSPYSGDCDESEGS